MSDYRLLALDIDGTLLSSERVVTPRTKAAILAARAAGLVIVVATGRGSHSARNIVLDLDLGGPVTLVATQGATVWANDQLVLHQPLSTAAARRVVDHSLNEDVAALIVPGLHGAGAMHLAGSSAAAGRLRAYAYRNSGNAENVRPYDPSTLDEDPLAVYMMDDWLRLVALNERLTNGSDARDDWRVIFSRTALASTAAIEVLHPKVSKAFGLQVLCDRFSISSEEVLAFGDNVNDVEMLKFAGLGVAMGNGSPEACAAADRITASNDHDGIAVVLEEMKLAQPWTHTET